MKANEPNLPKTKECHCMATAHKYLVRTFINQMNHKVYRVFYRCENCWSRIHDDIIPEMDALPSISLEDMMNKFRNF